MTFRAGRRSSWAPAAAWGVGSPGRWFTGYGLAVVGWNDRSGDHVEKHNASSFSGANFTIEIHHGADKKGTVYVALTDADNRVTYCQKVFYVTISV
ncbi:hypothetical protein OG394_04985 [Kribbella sp. NBC_01245]|uniref:hypothetical protein n=1 Tax=Kribbella sp. NBC_01245 TaxID=2903578 RepID=UPI002E295539|nr:hypothetical protein [Kribbella sp. NBC_01245]